MNHPISDLRINQRLRQVFGDRRVLNYKAELSMLSPTA